MLNHVKPCLTMLNHVKHVIFDGKTLVFCWFLPSEALRRMSGAQHGHWGWQRREPRGSPGRAGTAEAEN